MKTAYIYYHHCILSLLIMFSFSIKTEALNYNITFTGNQPLSSVEVQNLTKGTKITVPSGDVLVLVDVLSGVNQPVGTENDIAIYPNPMQEKATVSFFAPKTGTVQLNVFGVDGRNVTSVNSPLLAGYNSFQLSLAPGAYILKVNGDGYSYAQRVISKGSGIEKPFLSFISHQKATNSQPKKSKSNVTSMQYSTGDQMLYRGISGNNSTVVTDKLTESKTINFNFVECKDADDNHYSVVTIGTQTWMVENLKTTKYRNGESIPSPAGPWNQLTTGAQTAYDNNAANATKYGLLYNWFSVNDSRNIAPVGWHVATHDDWSVLADYVHNNPGSSISGAKSLAATTDWAIDASAGAVGNNLTLNNSNGFSALPSGYRTNIVLFNEIGRYSYWWSSTTYDAGHAWGRFMYYDSNGVTGYHFNDMHESYAVRCIRDSAPKLLTSATARVTNNSANCGGNVTSDGGAPITVRGICWSTSAAPTTALSTKTTESGALGVFSSTMTSLTPNTKYYVRAYATNNEGTVYGAEKSFTTQVAQPTVTDIDNNVYTYVTIGTQTWMVENLKTTKYRDGSAIANVTNDNTWAYLTTGAWCDYNNSSANGTKYGHLYNWFAVNDSRKIAPLGWHVATDEEWTILVNYVTDNLGTSVSVAKALASASHWTPYTINNDNTMIGYNLALNNSTGFSALPGAYRGNSGIFEQDFLGIYGIWWSASEKANVANQAWGRDANHFDRQFNRFTLEKQYGFSVRCVKD